MEQSPDQSVRASEAAVKAGWKTSFVRFLPLVVLASALAAILLSGLHKSISLEAIVGVRDRFQAVLTEHRLLSILIYIGAYALAVALSVPGALFITIAGGLMFGWLMGGAAAVAGASTGAVLIYLAAKTAFGDVLREKAGPWLARMIDGFKQDALSYLLFLRLIPAIPFFVVNIAAALLGVPLRSYVIGTVIGIIPATFAFATVGAGLDSVIVAAKAEHAACIAAKGAAACSLTINPGTLVTRELMLALVLLGLVALIPVAYKIWSARHAR
jgi:uncharacterized membrane protein YdjX (TVP38/TMEM64 family)